MMQDLPRLFQAAGFDAKVSFVQMERWVSYTPVKNGAKHGAACFSKGLPAMTASTGEAGPRSHLRPSAARLHAMSKTRAGTARFPRVAPRMLC